MRYEDFAAITHPIVGRFARQLSWREKTMTPKVFASIASEPKIIFWHRDAFPPAAEAMDEHTLESSDCRASGSSRRVTGSSKMNRRSASWLRGSGWNRCPASLRAPSRNGTNSEDAP